VRDGKLREDLLYRLNVFPICLPPLRDRGDDVVLLVSTFLQELNHEQGRGVQIGREAFDLLRRYRWPGNVRELKNLIHRAFILADTEISTDCLPVELRPGERETPCPEPGATANGPNLHVRVGESVADVERRLILATLHHHSGNKQKTAEVLGISLKTLYNRLNQYRGAA
jgi:DNA-binding NtrC family response regulator